MSLQSRSLRAWMQAVLLAGLLPVYGQTAWGQMAGELANGTSAAAASRGGIMAAEHGDPLDAVEGNPAGLAGIRARVLDLSAIGVIAAGSFQNSVDPNGHLASVAQALPYGAVGMPVHGSRWIAGFAVTPDEAIRVRWSYLDPAGTAGVSYGEQGYRSEIAALRGSGMVARTLGSKWALGATAGLVYNANTLQSPYIFQEQPELAGLKVLLDLHTHGWGWNGSAGAQWQASDRVRVGAAWKSATYVTSHGDASGTASALFAALGIAADPAFHYRAEVDNTLPQTAAVGMSWQMSPRTRLGAEGGWTGWSGAFRQLPVKLTQGTNATINSVAGADAIEDFVPLHWRDQGAVRVGLETALKRGWAVRGGYAYASNPVPAKTLTPMTAGILQNSVGGGAGWSREKWQWDVAYQAQLPSSERVGVSELQAGEYSHSQVRVMVQSVTVSGRFSF